MFAPADRNYSESELKFIMLFRLTKNSNINQNRLFPLKEDTLSESSKKSLQKSMSLKTTKNLDLQGSNDQVSELSSAIR